MRNGEVTVVEETFVPPSSSNIASFTYDPDTQTLTVEFVSGDSYAYFNVPVSTYRAWCSDGGGGKFFYRQIRGRYAYEQQ